VKLFRAPAPTDGFRLNRFLRNSYFAHLLGLVNPATVILTGFGWPALNAGAAVNITVRKITRSLQAGDDPGLDGIVLGVR